MRIRQRGPRFDPVDFMHWVEPVAVGEEETAAGAGDELLSRILPELP